LKIFARHQRPFVSMTIILQAVEHSTSRFDNIMCNVVAHHREIRPKITIQVLWFEVFSAYSIFCEIVDIFRFFLYLLAFRCLVAPESGRATFVDYKIIGSWIHSLGRKKRNAAARNSIGNPYSKIVPPLSNIGSSHCSRKIIDSRVGIDLVVFVVLFLPLVVL
jgi:hypothetical protein